LVCLLASDASAGRIYGDIKTDGRPVPEGLKVKIAVVPPADTSAAKTKLKASPTVVDSTVTDKFGSYKLAVKTEGKCVLALYYGKEALTLDVFSYKEAVRYDLIVEKKEGKLTLRRK
jgi:hypothetical protein